MFEVFTVFLLLNKILNFLPVTSDLEEGILKDNVEMSVWN